MIIHNVFSIEIYRHIEAAIRHISRITYLNLIFILTQRKIILKELHMW